MPDERPTELERVVAEEGRVNLFKDFFYFLAHNKKWWLLPIVIVLVLLSVLMLLSTSSVAPFIYTLF